MRMRPRWLVAIAGSAVLLLVPPFLKGYGLYLLSYWLVFAIAPMGLNLTSGTPGKRRSARPHFSASARTASPS